MLEKITMDSQHKTKIELLKELAILKLDNQSLKEKYEQDFAELKNAEAEIKTILRTAMDGFCLLDQQGRILEINDSYCTMIGYSREELLKMSIKEILAGNAVDIIKKVTKKVLENGSDYFESKHKCKDGKEIDIAASVNFIKEEQVKFFCFLRDITRQKQTEAELHENENIFKELFDKAPIGYHELDSQGRITRINHTELDMFSYTEDEMVGQYVWKFVNDEEKSHQRVLEKLKGLLPPSVGAEIEYRRKDLTTFPASVEDSILRDANDNVIGMRTTVQDITNRKKAEQEIQSLNEQLLKSNSEKDKFFSIIAHDLKSPFHGFLNLTQTIVEDAGKLSIQELAQLGTAMHHSADNLFKLLQNLLEWALMQKGSISLLQKDILLTNMIAEYVEAFKVRSEQKGISIVNLVKDPIHAYADEKMINSVLLNLLSNAVKYTGQNGVITIIAKETENKMIEVSVRDTGTGMSKSIVDKLFIIGEKTGRKGTDGELSTGLGLLLCKEFINKNAGEIWVESEDGVGSNFYFTLPLKDTLI